MARGACTRCEHGKRGERMARGQQRVPVGYAAAVYIGPAARLHPQRAAQRAQRRVRRAQEEVCARDDDPLRHGAARGTDAPAAASPTGGAVACVAHAGREEGCHRQPRGFDVRPRTAYCGSTG